MSVAPKRARFAVTNCSYNIFVTDDVITLLVNLSEYYLLFFSYGKLKI